MSNVEKLVHEKLFCMQDEKYKEFSAKLMPTVDKNKVIGVRTPRLRKFARSFAKTSEAMEFIKILPHKYYEENNLHGFIIETFNDYAKAITALDNFLPYVDNWATCDSVAPKVFKKHLPELYIKIQKWIESGKTYTIRYGIGMLLRFYLDEAFCEEHLELVAQIKSDEYYVNMMRAWYFATAFAKQYSPAVKYIEQYKLDKWTHNKAIQKAVESFRISEDQKKYLKKFKIHE